MRLSRLDFHFLPCLIMTVCSAKLEKCDERTFESLKYCGVNKSNINFPKRKQNQLTYLANGRFCNADSMSQPNYKHLDWDKAHDACLKDGARLAEFHSIQDWNAFTKEPPILGFKKSSWYFLGGKSIGRPRWYWMTNFTQITKSFWASGEPDGSSEQCILMHERKWYDGGCHDKHPYICQKVGREAYEDWGNLTIIPAKKAGSTYTTGETVEIICTAKTIKTGLLRIKTQSVGTYTISDNKHRITTIDEIKAFDIEVGATYFWEHERCFRHSKMRTKIKLNRFLQNSTIQCTRTKYHRERAWLNKYDVYFKFILKISAEPPHVVLKGSSEEQLEPVYGDRLEYLCQGRVAEEDFMSFVIIQGGQTWAMSVSKTGSFQDSGQRPDWVYQVDFKTDSGKSASTSLDYINLRATFVYDYRIKDASFGCYSNDVTEKVSAGEKLSRNDSLGWWMDFKGYTSTKLEIHNLTQAELKSKDPVSANRTFRVSCDGFGVSARFLKFQIITGKSTYEWKFPDVDEMPEWAKVKWAEEFHDKLYGASFRIAVLVSVNTEMKSSKFTCAETNQSDQKKEAAINLKIKEEDDDLNREGIFSYIDEDDYVDYEEDYIDDIVIDDEETVYYNIWFVALFIAGSVLFYCCCCRKNASEDYDDELSSDDEDTRRKRGGKRAVWKVRRKAGRKGRAESKATSMAQSKAGPKAGPRSGPITKITETYAESTVSGGQDVKSQASYETKATTFTALSDDRSTNITSLSPYGPLKRGI